MALSAGYLTYRQKQIWNMKSKGLSEASIAKRLGVTRQTIHKALNVANSKVYVALKEAAKINRIKIKTIDPTNGILVGYSPDLKTKALITFSTKNGIQVWYKHRGDCEKCDQLHLCKEVLLAEARERNIQLPENANLLLPSELAELLFSKIIGE
jgi:DNA-binding CsgD family transcriptional regulator